MNILNKMACCAALAAMAVMIPARANAATAPTRTRGRRERERMTPMVIATDVVKRFGRFTALAGVSLALDRSEVLCIVGPSGSGKSTFLRCVNHLERLDDGRIHVDGELIGYSERRLARGSLALHGQP